MSNELNAVFREAHRLRRHLRDVRSEIEGLPRVKKAHQAKVAKQEQLLKDAQEAVKAAKSANHDREVNLKATHQQLVKYEKQMSDMATPKEVQAKQTEIATSRAHIAQLEEDILNGLVEIDDRVAKVPPVEEQLKRAKAEFAKFEGEAKEREERLHNEVKLAEEELKKVEVEVPATVKSVYDRLIKAHGADALSAIKQKDRICAQCLTAITVQNINELIRGQFLCCNNCGRGLYLIES